MAPSYPDRRRRGTLLALLLCGTGAWLPAQSQRADNRIDVFCNSNWLMYLNTGTQSCDGIRLRQGDGMLIEAAHVAVSGLDIGGSGYEDSRWEFRGTVHIEHEGTVLDADTATLVFSGDRVQRIEVLGTVHIEHEGAVLDADTATVVFSGDRVQRIEVLGQPARFAHQLKAKEQRYLGRANSIQYDTTSGDVRFEGDTWYDVDGRGEVTMETLLYNTNDGTLRSPGPTSYQFTLPERRVPTPATPDRSTAP